MNFFLDNKLVFKNRYSILPGSGVDLEYFKFSEYPSNKVIKFLFIGRLIKEKGINEFLEAAAKIKKIN